MSSAVTADDYRTMNPKATATDLKNRISTTATELSDRIEQTTTFLGLLKSAAAGFVTFMLAYVGVLWDIYGRIVDNIRDNLDAYLELGLLWITAGIVEKPASKLGRTLYGLLKGTKARTALTVLSGVVVPILAILGIGFIAVKCWIIARDADEYFEEMDTDDVSEDHYKNLYFAAVYKATLDHLPVDVDLDIDDLDGIDWEDFDADDLNFEVDDESDFATEVVTVELDKDDEAAADD